MSQDSFREKESYSFTINTVNSTIKFDVLAKKVFFDADKSLSYFWYSTNKIIETRYGFNGKEKDDEVKGAGDSYDYGARIYDPRIGKFLSVDKLTKNFSWYTPYQFAGNTPIQAIDLDGKEIYYSQSGEQIGKYGSSTEVRVEKKHTFLGSSPNLQGSKLRSFELKFALNRFTINTFKEL
jgi:RHS repeat-associated protein